MNVLDTSRRSDGNTLRPANYGQALLMLQTYFVVGQIISAPTDYLVPMDIPETMLASEDILRRDWDTPEEDAAWAHL